MTYEIESFPEYVGKPIKELYDHLKAEYGDRLAKLPDDLSTLPDEMKDGSWYCFFGSAYRDSSYHRRVPYAHWCGDGFVLDGDWLDYKWDPNDRVVLLKPTSIILDQAVEVVKAHGYKIIKEL